MHHFCKGDTMSKESPMEREFQRIAEEISRGGSLDFPSEGESAFNNIVLPPNGFAEDEAEEIEIELADLPIRDELLDDGGFSYEATCYWPGSDETVGASVTHGETTHALIEFKGDGQWEFTSSNLTPIELLAILKQISETIEENLEELDEQWDGRREELGTTPPATPTNN